MTILGISDWIDPLIYSEKMKYRMSDVDVIISCGDVTVEYLDFVMSELNKPLLYVVGNHVSSSSYHKVPTGQTKLNMPQCFKNLHLSTANVGGLLMAGFEGSIWYNGGPFQYKQWQAYLMLLRMVPRLIYNKLVYGRFIDIFVAHSPPYKVGDREDRCHTGLKAFNLFIKLFKPKIFIHGHVHVYDRNVSREMMYEGTKVINCSGFYKTEVNI